MHTRTRTTPDLICGDRMAFVRKKDKVTINLPFMWRCVLENAVRYNTVHSAGTGIQMRRNDLIFSILQETRNSDVLSIKISEIIDCLWILTENFYQMSDVMRDHGILKENRINIL